MIDFVDDVAGELWATGDELNRYGAHGQGKAVQQTVSVVKRIRDEWLDEVLEVREAAEWAGWSYSGLADWLREHPEYNAGEEGSPRIRRRNVPLRRQIAPVREDRGQRPKIVEAGLAGR